jgi:hypothetical protein
VRFIIHFFSLYHFLSFTIRSRNEGKYSDQSDLEDWQPHGISLGHRESNQQKTGHTEGHLELALRGQIGAHPSGPSFPVTTRTGEGGAGSLLWDGQGVRCFWSLKIEVKILVWPSVFSPLPLPYWPPPRSPPLAHLRPPHHHSIGLVCQPSIGMTI